MVDISNNVYMPIEDKQIFLGIDHPAIAANDVDVLAEWYCDAFAYKKLYRHDKPVWMLLSPDNTLLEIMPKDDAPRPQRTTWTPGWSHLAIRVSNIELAVKYLDSKGVNWGGSIVDAYGGGRVRNLYDIEGNMLQILERVFA